MEITAKSLRNRIGAVLDCVERGDPVIVTYRGKPRARIVRIGARRPDAEAMTGFGMWKDNETMRGVDVYVRNLRKPRHAG